MIIDEEGWSKPFLSTLAPKNAQIDQVCLEEAISLRASVCLAGYPSSMFGVKAFPTSTQRPQRIIVDEGWSTNGIKNN